MLAGLAHGYMQGGYMPCRAKASWLDSPGAHEKHVKGESAAVACTRRGIRHVLPGLGQYLNGGHGEVTLSATVTP